MIKAGLIIVTGITIVSGCAFVDGPRREVKTTAGRAPSVALKPELTVKETNAPSVRPAPAVTRRVLTPDDIRRMQVRMREVGLAPGPVNGIAGGRTKAALKRFQFGCVVVRKLLEERENAAFQGAWLNRVPRRQETLAIQNRLREAGFNPGPIDGIFGPKMKAIFSHLQNGCPAAPEFIALLEQPAGDTHSESSAAVNFPTEPRRMSNPPVTPMGTPPDESIRALQLRLRDAGYDPGPLDGIMGPKTELALQQMQANERNRKSKRFIATGIGTEY